MQHIEATLRPCCPFSYWLGFHWLCQLPSTSVLSCWQA